MIAKLALVMVVAAASGCVAGRETRNPELVAEVRAIAFLRVEVPAWSRENHCFSCHNNGDAARALYVAARKGHRLPASALADTTAWITQPNRWDDNQGDPGFSDQRLANLQFAASLAAAVAAGHVPDRRPLREAARKVAADQGTDGAWAIEPGQAVGSPATYGTTLATYLAWRTLRQARSPDAREAIRKAESWLHRAPANNVLAAATLLLAVADDPDVFARPRRDELLALLCRAQTSDGGWGPYVDSPPEAFDTAVVLLALTGFGREAGVPTMIQRGRTFLAADQNPDGSWPATTRPPGGISYAQRLSTTGWATLALLETRGGSAWIREE